MRSIRFATTAFVVASTTGAAVVAQPCPYTANVRFNTDGILAPFAPLRGGGVEVQWSHAGRAILESSHVWRSCAWTALIDCGSGDFGWGFDQSIDDTDASSQHSSGSQLAFGGTNTATVLRQSGARSTITASVGANNGGPLYQSNMAGDAWHTLAQDLLNPVTSDRAYRGGNGFSQFSAVFTLGPSFSPDPIQLNVIEFLNFSGQWNEIGAQGAVLPPEDPCSQPQGIRDYLYWDETNEIRCLNTVEVLIDGQVVYSNTFVARAVRGGSVEVLTGGSTVQLSSTELTELTVSAGNEAGLYWQLDWQPSPFVISLPASESSVVLEIRHQVAYGNRDADAFAPCGFQIPAGFSALTCPSCVPAACPADVAGIGGSPGPDGQITGDDFNAFITWFAAGDANADITGIGEDLCPDGLVTGEDFNAFIASFSAGCP